MSKSSSYTFIAVVLFILFTGVALRAARLYGQERRVSPMTLDRSLEEEGVVKPKISNRVITVGGGRADIPGYTSAAIQIAVDALKSGGGTVKLNPGTFEIMAPVRLGSGVWLVGSGERTILHKVNGYRSPLILDCGYGMLKVTVKDPSGFKIGMGVIIQDAENNAAWAVTTAKITAIEGNTLYIDNYTTRDYQSGLEGIVSNACSLVEAVEAEDVRIANFVIDGNKQSNNYINGCRGGAVYLHKSRRCLIENVKVKNFNGDGMSWQISEDITVRNCQAQDGTNYGFHPGTGSVRTTLEGCDSHGNGTDGIFVCWRVQNGKFKNNASYNNGGHGISVGHKDTDNIFENNHIYGNGGHGIYLRDEVEQNGGHRNTFRHNLVENNGGKEGGYGFYIDGVTRDLVIEDNTIRDTGTGSQKGGIYIGERASNIKVARNQMAGHTEADVVDNSGKWK